MLPAHTASSLQIIWQYPGSQGTGDESTGIDNILISDTNTGQNSPVPEPSTMALAGLALAALAFKKHR